MNYSNDLSKALYTNVQTTYSIPSGSCIQEKIQAILTISYKNLPVIINKNELLLIDIWGKKTPNSVLPI